MLLNLLKTDIKCFLFLDSVLALSLVILWCGYADNRLKRLYHLAVIHLTDSQYNIAILNTSCSFHNNMLSGINLIISSRCEKIYLSSLPEADSNNFSHYIIS